MLVLTRKKHETIQIGDSIVIKVISTGRGKVKIGIDAPSTTRVLRGELAQLIADNETRISETFVSPEATVKS
ncbi:carbon storage regulator [Thalassoglobus sp.]|uniref:carbon storage regulator n=1 Tax=Thalassoglobus sp. TaxID=2795869 RepID=UPI003AA8FBC6